MPAILTKEHTVTSQRGRLILTQVFSPGVDYNSHVIIVSYTELHLSMENEWFY